MVRKYPDYGKLITHRYPPRSIIYVRKVDTGEHAILTCQLLVEGTKDTQPLDLVKTSRDGFKYQVVPTTESPVACNTTIAAEPEPECECACVRVCVYVCVCMYACMCVCMHVCMSVYLCVCTCTHFCNNAT